MLFKKIFFSKIWRVVKIFNSKSDPLEKFNSKSDKFWNFFSEIWLFLVFQVLAEWCYILPTLIPNNFDEENWKTISVTELVFS